MTLSSAKRRRERSALTSRTEAVVHSATSSRIVQDIFELHFPKAKTVLDLTYGLGAFWRWDYKERGIALETNDLFRPADHAWDLTQEVPVHVIARRWDVVVFDPPFSSMGPPSKGGDANSVRYGSRRREGLKNVEDVRLILTGGLICAAHFARKGVLVKVQDVIESGLYHDMTSLTAITLAAQGLRPVDRRWFLTGRRPQPDADRGAKVRHFRNRPSVFMVYKR